MKVIGITGGIGSGKTTMCLFFEEFSVPVYYADNEAKMLINRSKVIRRKLFALFGEQAYNKDGLNRDYIREQIFANDDLRNRMNAIVHPKVKSHFERWVKNQKAPYVLKEAAIIFEINQQDTYDFIILVTADKEIRIKRVVDRDSISRESVERIMDKQLPDEEKLKRADFVITNNDLTTAKQQVADIHNKILKICSDS